MNELQLELTRLIGKRGEWNGFIQITPSTLSDFHRWMNENFGDTGEWKQKPEFILSMEQWNMKGKKIKDELYLPYDSSKDLLDQDEETLKQIISLIKENEKEV